eukprot:scaffold77611_cov22-Tisochrysis_lutea.AAC.1
MTDASLAVAGCSIPSCASFLRPSPTPLTSRAAPPSSIPTLIQPIHTVCPSMDGPLAPNACAQLNCVRSASPVTTARFQVGDRMVDASASTAASVT